ncbi:hypothetical protein ACFWPX_34635 [Nocardia sp. NPDC058518]|uniref:hypothetical protein n=1 Tax=Nocardia sp. NPDC058518 TaxID=3346534 RepID=UPI00364B60C1
MNSTARFLQILFLLAGTAVLLIGMGTGISIYHSTGVLTDSPENRNEIKRMVVDASWKCSDTTYNAGRECQIDRAAVYMPRNTDLPIVLVLGGIGLIGAAGAVAVGARPSMPASRPPLPPHTGA